MAETKHCGTCKHGYLGPGYEPCKSCGDDCSNWEVGLEIVSVEEHCKEPEKNYTYYVVYSFVAQDGTTGIRGSLFDLDHKIDAVGVIMLQEMILKKNDFKEACILNWSWFEG